MEEVSLPGGPALLTGLTISLNLNVDIPSNQADTLSIRLFSGVNENPAAADALASAIQLGTTQTAGISGAAGDTIYFVTFSSPIPVPGTLAAEFTLLGNPGFVPNDVAPYSARLSGNFTIGSSPNVGSNALAGGKVWDDADINGTFTGAEQTNFTTSPPTNIRFSLQTANTVPEPSTWAFISVAAVFGIFGVRRSRPATAA